MEDNYIRISDDAPRMPPQKLLIAAYVSQAILYILIIVYCILSSSLFSTLAMLYMLLSLAFIIAPPYYIQKRTDSQRSVRIYAYPVERIGNSIFLAINICAFIFKLIVCLTETQGSFSPAMQQFLQIQSLLYMFLPLLMLPFSAISIIIRTRSRDINEFKHQVNKLVTTPIFLSMGILILLIEIFSISISGFLFFINIMVLFVQRKIDFSSFVSWFNVLAVQIVCLLFFTANFLATSNLILSFEQNDIYRFYGIDGLNNFLIYPTSRGYVICLLILFFVCCFIQRIFNYNRIWLVVNSVFHVGQIKQNQIFLQQGVNIDQSANRTTERAPLAQSPEKQVKRQNRYSLQIFELQSVERGQSEERRNRSQFQNYYGQPQLKKMNSQQPKRSSSIESQSTKQKRKRISAKYVVDYLLIGINKFVDFIYSVEFSLRFTEIISIIVIQRYNNVYSFVTVLWLAMVASTERIKLIYIVTLFILLPVEIGNYIILYAYNAAESPINYLEGLQNFGFQPMQLFWLDIIIFNVYLFYMITFLLAASQDKNRNLHRKSSIPNSKILVLICAFIFRYSYLLTIAAMFFLGFSKVTLMNLVYVILFLVFFSSGQNVLVEIKKRNQKQITTLTTFSRKYWFLIVYYTLVCIILKYIYFLFFDNKLTQALEPTGINGQYQWSFNFSLSSICKSNTSPLFIIFVLSQAQIMIYRSAIYLNYSFSLASQVTDIKNPRKSRFRILMNTVTQLILQFYYQSLWYISGLIILACSYRWNILSLCIIIVTCLGLMRGFNKIMLAFIVFMDLTNIILNYLVLFTTYEVSQNFIGETGLQVINKVSLFLGLIISSNNNLSGVFALNIVIFYFGVESYGLKKILQEDRFNEQLLFQEAERQEEFQNQEQIIHDTISSYEPTVLEQQSNDLQFAKNFNKNVIIATKRLYSTVLWRKYGWWMKICRFLSIFSTDIITIFVLVCCLCFRLSVSMFYFLFLYMIYYFALFDRIGELMEEQQFYERIQRQYQCFKAKQAILSDKQNSRSIITGEQSSTAVIAFIIQTKEKAIRMRYKWRYILWFYTSIVNIGCILLVFAAQFILSDFYINYLNPSWTTTMEDVLFVLGVSVTNQTSFFRQVYFYYFMVIFAVVEKLVLGFIKDIKEQESLQKQPSQLNRKQIKDLQDPINFIDQSLNFIESVEINEKLLNVSHEPILLPQEEDNAPDFSSQSNILIYFDYKGATIKINYLYGLLMFMLRFYLLVMLINLYEKSNIFAFAYLFAVLYFWFQKLHFRMVKNINKVSIIILLLQYIILLFDINSNTSSLPLPSTNNLSILSIYITNPDWVNYLVVDFNKQSIGSYLLSFLTSAILIFLTQLYFTLFFWISKNCMAMIRQVYDRYEYIGQNLQRMPEKDTIYLNFANYKNWGYRVMKMSYQLLINNSYIFISYLILILLSGIHNYISLGLVCFACIYIYLGIFTGFSEDKNIYSYTTIFFRIVQGILFLVLIAITVAEIPIFQQKNSIILHIQSLSNVQQIFLLFLIQIWLDLSVSQEFKQATNEYNNRVANRQNVMIKSIAYQQNKDLIQRLLKRYKQAMWFQVNLKNALDIIDQWHSAMYKQKNMELENLKRQKNKMRLKSIEQEIKKSQERRPEQDEQISQIILQYMESKTSVALKCGYYQIMRYVVFNNHRLIELQHTNIDIWDYILENYQKLNQRIVQADQSLDVVIKAIQSQDFRRRMERLQQIKKQQFSEQKGNLNQLLMGIIKTPKKILIQIKPHLSSASRTILLFVMSNFPYILSFFTWIYYMINPCLLSLPFIIYFFAFQIISDHKLTSIMLIYIFSIIVLALELQIQVKQNAGQQSLTYLHWRKYLFYQHEDGTYMYAVGYLFFIFILIFINEEIKKYQGNKFKHPHEAQNRMRGAFRMLLNQDVSSQHYLWDLIDDQNEQQKQCNPMHYVSIKIQEKPQILTDCPLPGFFESFNEGKTGIDLYPLIATVQIFLTIYLIFFYPLMTESSTTDLEQSFKYFQFSSEMVLAVLMHVVSIVIERLITLINPQNPNKSLIKYIYTMIILALFLIFIYLIAPISRNIKGVYHPSNFLIAFAFFYFFYFFLSALQIRFGYKKYKSLNSLLTKRRMFNSLFVTVFTSVPFLYELKLMMDYSFTKTSLKIFDWFRLYSIYLAAFKAKMQYFTATGVILGEPQGFAMKSIGLFGFIGILIIIFGPMVLFSGLNPIAQPNLVTGGALQLGIQIQDGNYFQLYSTSHFSVPPLIYTPQLFQSENFSQVPALQILTSADIPQQFEQVQFQPYSDSNWGISYPNMQVLTYLMNKTITQLQKNQTPTTNFTISVKYALQRRVAETIASDTNFNYPLNGSLPLNQLQSLYKSITQCNQPTTLPGFYISLIRLFTVGNTYKPRPIFYYNSTGQNPYLEGINLTLYCDEGNSTSDTSNVYWGVISTNSSETNPDAPEINGIFLNVFCDKYQNLIAGLGFTALYTSVILVVAGFIRSMFENKIPDTIYFQNPKPDNLIQISEAIGTLRDRKQFRQEYLMYYQLIDIIRSPDLMKYLSGSYPHLIEQADQKRKKKEEDKEMSKKNKIQ